MKNLPPDLEDHIRLKDLLNARHWAIHRDLRHAMACGRPEMEREAKAKVRALNVEIEQLKRKLRIW